MNKITKEVRKAIAKIAKSLPVCYHKNKTVLVKVGVVDEKTIRVQEQQRQVNHKKELERAYERLGKVGVFQYAHNIHALANPVPETTEEVKQSA